METSLNSKKKATLALAVVAAIALCSAGMLMADETEAETATSASDEGTNGVEDLCAIAFVAVTIAVFTIASVMLFWEKEGDGTDTETQ